MWLRRPVSHAAIVGIAMVLGACGGASGGASGGATDLPFQGTSSEPYTPPVTGPSSGSMVSQPASTAGRLLASNCFQCHGTLGRGGFESIRGSDAAEVVEYLRKPADSSIMAAHAQGYTTAQLQSIVNYPQQ